MSTENVLEFILSFKFSNLTKNWYVPVIYFKRQILVGKREPQVRSHEKCSNDHVKIKLQTFNAFKVVIYGKYLILFL